MSISFNNAAPLKYDNNLEEFRGQFQDSFFDTLFSRVIFHYKEHQKKTDSEDHLFIKITFSISNDIKGHVASGKEDVISLLYMSQVRANFERDKKSPLPEQQRKIEISASVTTTTSSKHNLIERAKAKFDQVLAAIHEHENPPKPTPKLQQPPEDYEQIALALMEKMKKEGSKENRCTALLNALGTDGHDQMIYLIGKRTVKKPDGSTASITSQELKPLRDFFFQQTDWEDHLFEQGHFAFQWEKDFEELRALWRFIDSALKVRKVNERLMDRDYSNLALIPFFVRYFSESCNREHGAFGQWGYGIMPKAKYEMGSGTPFSFFEKSHPEFFEKLTELRMEILKYAESNPETFAEQASKHMITRRWLLQSDPFREIYWKYLKSCIAKYGQNFLDDPTRIPVVKDLLEDPLAQDFFERRVHHNEFCIMYGNKNDPLIPEANYTKNAVVCVERLLKLVEDSKKFNFDQSATELWSKENPFKIRLEELKQKKDKVYSQHQFELEKDKYEKKRAIVQSSLTMRKGPYQELHNKIQYAEQSIQSNKILMEESNNIAARLKECDSEEQSLKLQIANLEKEISKVDDCTTALKALAVFNLKSNPNKTAEETAQLKVLELELDSLFRMNLNAKQQEVESSAIQALRDKLILVQGKRTMALQQQSNLTKLSSNNAHLEAEVQKNKELQEPLKKCFVHLEKELAELDNTFNDFRQKVENDCADIDKEIQSIEKEIRQVFEKFKKENCAAIQQHRFNSFIMFLNRD